MIHRKQQKYFNKGEWKHLPLTRCLYGPPSETVREQLRPKFCFCITIIVYCQSKVKAIHYTPPYSICRGRTSFHTDLLTLTLLLISWPEMLFQHINDTGFVLLVYFTPGLVNCLSKCNHLFPWGVGFITCDPPPNTLKMRQKDFWGWPEMDVRHKIHLSLKDLKRVADVWVVNYKWRDQKG